MSSCAKMEQQTLPTNEEEGVYTELTASIEETRTSIDGSWKTTWDNNDAMVVYYTRNNTDYPYGYSNFKYVGNSKFEGTLYRGEKVSAPYNWFAVYPTTVTEAYRSSSVKPTINHPATQTMTGTSNSHIAANDPVYGYVLGKQTNAEFKMKHISTVLDFNIKNGAESSIKVTKIEFTAPDNIVGNFTAQDINLVGATESINPNWTADTGAGKTVTLTVNDGETIAAGDTANFYAAIHPSSGVGNYTIKVTATMGGKTVVSTKTITTSNDNKLTFTAGTKKTVNFTFAPKYVKVTTAPTDWTGTYLIVDDNAQKAFDENVTSSYAKDVTINKSANPYTIAWSETVAKYEVTINPSSEGSGKYDVKTVNGKYLFGKSSGILWDATITPDGNGPYYNVFTFYTGGSVAMYSFRTGKSGNTYDYFGYAISSFNYSDASDANTRRVQLYKLQNSDVPPTPPGTEFNLENKYLKAYLDAAETQYTNNTSSSIVSQYIGGSRVANDLPSPVSLSWTGDATSISIFEGTSTTGTAVKTMNFSSSSSVDIYNLIPGMTYSYKTSNNQTGTFNTTGRRRMIKVSNTESEYHARNCRDLGGIRTRDGKTLKYGLIYRGTNVDEITDAEKKILHDELGIRLDQDLRSEAKTKTSSTIGSDVEFCNHGGYDSSTIANQDGNNMKQSVLHVMNAVIEGRPVYFHCRIGSDRTGHMGMLYLALLGCDLKECDIDYEITSFASKMTGGTRTIGSGNEKSFRAKFVKSPYNYNSVPEAVEAYVTGTLGISLDTVKKFRKAMGASETLN